MSTIKELLSDCINLTKTELDHPEYCEKDYMTAIEKMVRALREASIDEIKAEKLDSELEQSLILDQKLLPLYCKTTAEQVSLMATLAAYRLSLQEELPKHSPVYMGWVATLKKRIEQYYGTEVKNYS